MPLSKQIARTEPKQKSSSNRRMQHAQRQDQRMMCVVCITCGVRRSSHIQAQMFPAYHPHAHTQLMDAEAMVCDGSKHLTPLA